MKFYATSTKAQIILEGGGYYSASKGMSVYRAGQGYIRASIFESSYKYIGQAAYEDVFHWQHIVFTWKVYTNILLYLNGCPVRSSDIFQRENVAISVDFKIGGNEWGGAEQRGNIALDHGILTHVEVWQLYIQGGQV